MFRCVCMKLVQRHYSPIFIWCLPVELLMSGQRKFVNFNVYIRPIMCIYNLGKHTFLESSNGRACW